MSMTNESVPPQTSEAPVSARDELRRAYMHVSFGQYDEAIAACERAAKVAPDHYLPPTLQGSFELACGRVRDALGTLRGVTRRHGDEPLPQIYFAEACLLSGRRRQGERALDKAERLADSEEVEQLVDELRQIWEAIDPSQMPPPLVVEFDDEE